MQKGSLCFQEQSTYTCTSEILRKRTKRIGIPVRVQRPLAASLPSLTNQTQSHRRATSTSYNDKRAVARASIVDYGINACISDFEQAKKLCELGVTAFGEIFIQNKTTDELSTLLQTIKDLNALGCIHAEQLYEGVDGRSYCDRRHPTR